MKPKPWLPYVLPMGVYMAFLLVQSNANLLWLYPVKTIAVAGTLWWFRKEYAELRPAMSWLGVAVGLLAIAIWIFGDRFYPKVDELMLSFEKLLSRLMNSPAPKEMLTPSFNPRGRYMFIGLRIVG